MKPEASAAFTERAARRRAGWKGDVASFSAMDEADVAFWRAAEPTERLAAATLLLAELHQLAGHDGPAPRLLRSVGGVRQR